MKYRAFKYIAKVWATSAFITPIIAEVVYFAFRGLINISSGLQKTPAQPFWISYLDLFVMVLLAPLIPWLVMILFAKLIVNSSLTIAAKKIILSVVPVFLFAGILLLGALANHFRAWQSVFEGWLSYAIAVALSSWFYRINPKTSIIKQTE